MSESERRPRVLIPVDPEVWKGGFGEGYIQGLVASFKPLGVTVVLSEEAFQKPCPAYDVVLLNWPEWLQKALNLDREVLCATIQDWKSQGSTVGVVLHNDAPHRRTKQNHGLYSLIEGHFDFAIHLGNSSMESHKGWANRHYYVPHPLMPFDQIVLAQGQRRGILVLGAMRNADEKEILHRFSLIARLRGLRVFVGSFRSFPEPNSPIFRGFRWVYWRLILRVQWNFGYVDGETLQRWQSQCRFMLIHRTDSHLNSAIPYTGMSNGLIPIGLGPGNVGEVLRQYQIPVLKSMGWMDVWRYVGRIRSSAVQVDFGQFERDHSLESVAAGLNRVLKGEGLI